VQFVAEFEGEYYASGGEKLGTLARVNTDFGDDRAAVIEMGFKHPEGKRFTAKSLLLGISQGFDDNTDTVGLSTSENNVLYGPTLFRNTGAQGRYSDRLAWNPPGGLGYYRGFMGIRLRTTDDVNFSADHLVIDT